MLGRYIITNHVMQRYEQRTNKVKQSTKSRIIRDLKALRNKRIVNIGRTKYIFYTQPNGTIREFVVEQGTKNPNNFYVTTVISRNHEESEVAYKKRLRQKEEYELQLKGEIK